MTPESPQGHTKAWGAAQEDTLARKGAAGGLAAKAGSSGGGTLFPGKSWVQADACAALKMEQRSIDLRTSRMLSERSTM